MNQSARNLLLLLFFLVPLLAASDEQQRAHKLLNKVTAMATDPSGKRAVNLAMSECLSLGREELAQRRHAMNMNYGDLFVAYQLVKSGAKMDEIAAKLKSGETIWQTADEQHANWKQITNEGKRLSGKVDTNLLRHFTNRKAEAERDQADVYDPLLDSVRADSDVSQQEIEDAQKRYAFLHDHAGIASGGTLDTSTEKSARIVRTDPVRSGGPTTPSNPPPKQ
jgi:hypothetical protein